MRILFTWNSMKFLLGLTRKSFVKIKCLTWKNTDRN